jgi:hypothetical protein
VAASGRLLPGRFSDYSSVERRLSVRADIPNVAFEILKLNDRFTPTKLPLVYNA